MRLFAKKVNDPEVCFCQNVIELLNGLSTTTTNVAWTAVTKNVLTKKGLMHIIEEHADNIAGYIVVECYPTDRNVLLNHAEALFEITTNCVDWREAPSALNSLFRVVKKMGLYNTEKKQLITKYLLDEDSGLNGYLLENFANMF